MPQRTSSETPPGVIRSDRAGDRWRASQRTKQPFNTPAPEIAGQISGLGGLLDDVDPRSARRLEELATALASENGRQRWSDVDLRRAFNTDRLAHAYAVKHEGGYAPRAVEIADKLRNVLVLVPILLTWFALGEAVQNYADAFDPNGTEAQVPFLIQWQRGFGGEASLLSPTLSHVAFLDAILILIIILLTFYAHGRREEQEDKISDTASLFQAEIDNALAEAGVILATDRSSRPVRLADSVERMADTFEESSQALLNQLEVEHERMERITGRRDMEMNDLGVFASGMRSGAEEMHRVLASLRQVGSGLERALDDLAGDINRSAEQQRSLLSAVANLERLTSSSIQNDQAATRQLAQTANRLSETTEKAITGAESAAQAGRVALDAIKAIGAVTQDVSVSQGKVDDALNRQNQTSRDLAESLRTSTQGAQSTARQLTQIADGLAAVQKDFANASEGHRNQIAALNAVMQRQIESGDDLAGLVREIGNLSRASAQRQSDLNDATMHLLTRLDSLGNTLNRLIVQTPAGRNDARSPERETDDQPQPISRWNRNRP